jgi:Flp pilus assembly protein TadG
MNPTFSKKIGSNGKRRRQSGTATIEFALVAPLLLLMVFGVVQLAWFFNNYVLLTDAASAGARVLASERGYSTPYTDAKNAVLTTTSTLNGTPVITMSVGGTACSSDTACASALGSATQAPATGTQATVALTYAFSPLLDSTLTNSLAALLPSNLDATMSDYVQ